MKKSNLFVGSVVSAGVAAFAVAALTFGGTSTTALAASGIVRYGITIITIYRITK